MALRAGTDSCALSLGVELNDDCSIDESTLIITPSIIHVNYRLAYDEVDEMLECGVHYCCSSQSDGVNAKSPRLSSLLNGILA